MIFSLQTWVKLRFVLVMLMIGIPSLEKAHISSTVSISLLLSMMKGATGAELNSTMNVG